MDTVTSKEIVRVRAQDACRIGGLRPSLSLEETVGYINRYLNEDFGEHVNVGYVDVDDSGLVAYPVLEEGGKGAGCCWSWWVMRSRPRGPCRSPGS